MALGPPGVGTIGTFPTLVSGLTITPGQHITVTLPVTVNTAGKVITNTATVTSNEVVLPQVGSVAITVTADIEPPTFPSTALITPTQGITLAASRPTFDWEDAIDAVGVVSYTLLLTGSPPFSGFGTLDTMDSMTTTESIFTPTQNLPNAIYTWTVQAHDSAGNVGTVTSPANFSIEVETDTNHIYLPVVLKNQ